MKYLIPALLFAACTTTPTMPEYQAAREAALRTPPPLTADWKPDASLVLSPDLVQQLITLGLESYGTIDDPVSLDTGGSVTPDLTIRSVAVGTRPPCPACLDIQARVAGQVAYQQATLKARVPLDATVQVAVEVSASDTGDGTWIVQLGVKDVSKVKIHNTKLPATLRASVDKALLDAARRSLLKDTKPITIAQFKPEAMPLRAVRAASTNQGIRVDMLTAATSPTPLGKLPRTFPTGWQLSIQNDSIMDLARKQSFEDGVIAWDVVAEPKSLRLSGGTYEMDLRLWMTTGSGWWRDYTVNGAVEPKDDGFALTTGDIVKTGMSEGAELVDPLAAIGESHIIDNIATSLNASLPKSTSESASKFRVTVDLVSIAGTRDTMHIRGDLKVRERKNR